MCIIAVFVFPIPWLSLALSDPQLKIIMVFVSLLISVWDPILALLIILLFISIEITPSHVSEKTNKNKNIGLTLVDNQKNMPEKIPSHKYFRHDYESSANELKQNHNQKEHIKAPSCANGIPGTTIGYPKNPPLGWNPDPVAPPTGEQVKRYFEPDVDPEIDEICNIPYEKLVEIQSNELQHNLNADEDTGRALVTANTMLL